MINVTEKHIETISMITDCRSLNRMEMIGFISCDIMLANQTSDLRNFFRTVFKGITLGPWTIKCNPIDNSINYIVDDCNIKICFIPKFHRGMAIEYYLENTLIYTSDWTVDQAEEATL